MSVLEYIPTDKGPDERIYIDPVPILFFIFLCSFLCWNRCGLLKSICSICCALSKKTVKEDLSPNYGTDLDEVTSVVEVACVTVFIRPFLCSFNMIRHLKIIALQQAGNTNPEYEGVDGGQGTKASDNHSNSTAYQHV